MSCCNMCYDEKTYGVNILMVLVSKWEIDGMYVEPDAHCWLCLTFGHDHGHHGPKSNKIGVHKIIGGISGL